MGSSSADKVRFFFELFRCRTEFYALHWEESSRWPFRLDAGDQGLLAQGDESGRRTLPPLTPEVRLTPTCGARHISACIRSAMRTPAGGWRADFDKEAAMLDALAYMKAARSYGIPAALEVSQSGRGAHVWIFFAHAISASVARSIATSLLGEAFRLRGSMHLSSYDRLFPSQDVQHRAWGG